MENLKLLNSPKGNYIFIFIGLAIAIPTSLFLAPMFISILIAPFKDDPIDVSHILGLFFAGLAIMLLPIHFFSVIFRMKQIYYSYSYFQISGKTIPWSNVEKITIFKGNSARFTIKYRDGQKIKKVFGSLFPFKRSEIIESLREIAVKNKIPISNWWI